MGVSHREDYSEKLHQIQARAWSGPIQRDRSSNQEERQDRGPEALNKHKSFHGWESQAMLRQGDRGQLLLPWPGTFLLLLNGLQSALTSTGLPQTPGKVKEGLWSQSSLSSCSGCMIDPWQVTYSSLMNLSFSAYKMVILRHLCL